MAILEKFGLDADINLLSPTISNWEGGYVDDPLDKGGCTNMGVTLATYRKIINSSGTCEDVKNMTINDFSKVLRVYWKRWKADEIINQSIANILVDWIWGSGVWGIKIPQRILGVKQDGIVGKQTLKAVNEANQKMLFDKIFTARKIFLYNIVKRDPTQKRFIKGWINRLNSFKYEDNK